MCARGCSGSRAIRADAAISPTRLIALTGCGQPEDRRRTAEAGFDAHLIKPVELDALENMLAHLANPSAIPSPY